MFCQMISQLINNIFNFTRRWVDNSCEVIVVAKIEVRIDSDTKERAKDVLAIHGLTIAGFVRLVLTMVANEGLSDSFPNRDLKDSFREIIADLSGEKELHEATSFEELEQLLGLDAGLESNITHD